MVGETTMNRHINPSPPNGVAKDVRELAHDILSLAELEYELFKIDCREGRRQILIAVALLLAAGMVAVGTVPIALILVAELFVQPGGLTRPTALSIAALIGLVITAASGVAGWFYLHRVVRALDRSRSELSRNIAWIKGALKPPAPSESQQHFEHESFPQ